MSRYVIEPQVAVRLGVTGVVVPTRHRLFAPTLLRSQALALLFAQVREGLLRRDEALRALDVMRGLRIRFLGDRVMQGVAWDIAQALGWRDTFVAEYVALTRLQADALVTDSAELAEAAARFVRVVPMGELLA